MKKHFLLSIIFLYLQQSLQAQQNIDSLLPVRGFCIGAPAANAVEPFTKFIVEELAPRKVNTLIVRIDYRYKFKSHPELADSSSLSMAGGWFRLRAKPLVKPEGCCLQDSEVVE